MKPPILFKKEEFTYFSKNDNFSINEDWRNTLLVWHTLKQEIIAEQFWLCRKDYASRLLGGFVPLSLHTVGHLHVRNLRGKGLGRVILLGGNCSTEPPEATEPQIHVFNETSKERWWHPECPAEYSVKLESTVCINSFFFSFEWNWVRNWPRIPQACWSTRASTDVSFYSGSIPIPYSSGRGRMFLLCLHQQACPSMSLRNNFINYFSMYSIFNTNIKYIWKHTSCITQLLSYITRYS